MSVLRRISIITINYNNIEGLRNTINSVLNQNYPNIEYIVIDGGSTDGSAELIERYDNDIFYWESERDKGIYHAMNKGIAHSTGAYCLFLNSGDFLHDKNSISDFEAQLSGEDILMGKLQCVQSGRIAYSDVNNSLSLWDFYIGCPVPHPASLIKKTLLERHPYDEDLKIVSDWKFFLQTIVFESCTYKIVDNIVTDFEEGGLSSDKFKCDQERKIVIDELIPAAIRQDYLRFEHGNGFSANNYDMFYSALKKYNQRLSTIVYSITVLLAKILSYCFSSLKFSRDFPVGCK